MSNVKIVTDSACDLAEADTAELGIEVVPLSIRFGNDEFVDRRDLSPKEFWRRVAQSPVLPETAAPSPGAFEQAFRSAAAAGATTVICINLSSKLSATYASAELAATSVRPDIDVRVIDSLSITMGQGSMVRVAAKMARAGESADTIVAEIESMKPRTRVYGALDTLDNLKKGGRIGGAKALIGSLLSVKPLLDISTGAVEELGKQRTRSKALAPPHTDGYGREEAVRIHRKPGCHARRRRRCRSNRATTFRGLPGGSDRARTDRRGHRHARRTARCRHHLQRGKAVTAMSHARSRSYLGKGSTLSTPCSRAGAHVVWSDHLG